MIHYLFFFFFSSRRRHTRSKRDWSSDVCSSDLVGGSSDQGLRPWTPPSSRGSREPREIGRASCRERVYISVVAVSVKKKKKKWESGGRLVGRAGWAWWSWLHDRVVL